MSKLEVCDLGEMLGICYLMQDIKQAKVQMDTEHAIEILERLLAWENIGGE